MNILVLNCGSSSAKYKLIEIKENKTLAEGGVEKIGLPDGFIKLKFDDGSKKNIDLGLTDHKGAIKAILDALVNPEYGCIKDLKEIDAVGHRVVHGGEKFSRSVLITDEVKDMIRECYGIAPLHNPVNMAGIEAIEAVLPGVPQVAVFDTAFHSTMPPKSYLYGLPYEYYEKYGVRRYGFHGTSHKFVAEKAAKMIGRDWNDLKIISCHLGSGASIAAIDHGKSVDTTMGMTALEGLIMGSRCGDVDPGVLLYLMDQGYDSKALTKLLYKQSGLIGISGDKQDMRDIRAGRDAGDERATYAFDMFALRVKRYIGGYMAEMAGGIGENAWFMRRPILENMECLGIKIDFSKNDNVMGEDVILSTPDSKVTTVVVTTDEEYVIASDTYKLVTK